MKINTEELSTLKVKLLHHCRHLLLPLMMVEMELEAKVMRVAVIKITFKSNN